MKRPLKGCQNAFKGLKIFKMLCNLKGFQKGLKILQKHKCLCQFAVYGTVVKFSECSCGPVVKTECSTVWLYRIPHPIPQSPTLEPETINIFPDCNRTIKDCNSTVKFLDGPVTVYTNFYRARLWCLVCLLLLFFLFIWVFSLILQNIKFCYWFPPINTLCKCNRFNLKEC